MKSKFIFFVSALLFLSACSKKQADEDVSYSSTYKAAVVSNGGTIKGTVKTDSNQKYLMNIETQKDQEVCGLSHKNPGMPNINGTVPNCIIGIERISQGKDFVKKEFSLDQHGCDFHPHIQIVNIGSSVVVANSDGVLHNYHVNHNGETVLNEAQPEGAPPREMNLKQKGLHIITCDVHPWMKGYIWVADHPYYTLSDSTGAFSLTDVPPGKYKLILWRDNWDVKEIKNAEGNISSYQWAKDISKEQEVTVEAGKDVMVNFTLP